MKLLIVILTFISTLSFSHKDSFHEDFLSFKISLDNYVTASEQRGDTVSARREIKLSLAKLHGQEDRMEMEQASRWDSFESAWPLPPANWRCHLECVYQSYLCIIRLGGDWSDDCTKRYWFCSHNCQE